MRIERLCPEKMLQRILSKGLSKSGRQKISDTGQDFNPSLILGQPLQFQESWFKEYCFIKMLQIFFFETQS